MPQTPEHTHALLMFYFGVSVNQTDVLRSNSSASGQCQNLVNVPHRCTDFLNGVTEHFGGKNGKNLYLITYMCMYVSCQNWRVYSCLFVTILMKDNRQTVMLTLFATTTHFPSSQSKPKIYTLKPTTN